MKKRNKILLWSLATAVVCLLIALCFVGNTFARYTLSESESVTVSIAEWGIKVDDDSNTNGNLESATLTDVKPLATPFEDAELPRTNEMFVCAAEITNTGDVAASVQITLPADSKVTAEYKDSNYSVGDDEKTYGSSKTASELEGEIDQHFKVTVYWASTSGITESTSTDLNSTDKAFDLAASSGDVFIYFDIVWITDLYDDAAGGYVNGDDFDSWAGINVSGFTYTVQIDAYQVADATGGSDTP